MSAYDSYDGRPYDSRRYFEDRRERLDPQRLDPQRLDPQRLDPQRLDPQRLDPQRLDPQRLDPRYTETQETYYRVNPTSRTALVPRGREDSDLSIEEVRRDFPPPGHSRDIRRARSADPGHEDYYHESRRSYSSRDRYHGKKPASVYYEEEERTRKHVLSKQEKIIAAVAGGLIAAGAKEVWDRREAEKEGIELDRNIAATAALGAAGAFAGYQGADFYNKHQIKDDKKSTYIVHKGRDGRVSEYYSDDDEDPKNRKGNKSFLENALSAAGLGGAIKALTGSDDKDKERDREDRHYDTRSRHSSPDSYHSYHSGRSHRSHRSRDDPAKRMQKAAKASLVAGAAEAFRVAKEPGGWQGEKMKRVLTAAAGAATIDAAHDPTKDGKRHLLESVVGGLVGNRMLNGSRKDIEEDQLTGRSRSRSRARSRTRSRSGSRSGGRSGLAALATAGLGALGAKKYAQSRSRSRSRRHSYDSYDSRSPSPPRRRSRSRSIVDGARRSLAKIGLGSGPDTRRDDDLDDRSARGSRHRSPDSRYSDDYTSRGYMRGGRGPEDEYDYDDDRSAGGRSRSVSRSRGRSSSVSSSDLGDSDDDEKRESKMRRKQLITAGLAAVATIHAAHNVYGSMEARNKRHKAVRQGKLSPEEARKLRTKAIMQDAASIGVAALGIKGAVSELKEVREQAHEVSEWREERKRRHERRAERLKRAKAGHRSRSRSDNWSPSGPPHNEGPRYNDGNPYSALPAPPMSYERR